MGHRDAPLTPQGRLLLCRRIEDSTPIAHVAERARADPGAMKRSTTTAHRSKGGGTSTGQPLLGAAIVALAAAAAYGLFFRARSDYVGHLLAGYGGTLLLLALPLTFPRRVVRSEAVLLMLLAVGVGAVFEATIFRLAIFDPVDFFNQSLGAVVAAASVIGRAGSVRLAAGFAALGMAALGAGFRFAFA